MSEAPAPVDEQCPDCGTTYDKFKAKHPELLAEAEAELARETAERLWPASRIRIPDFFYAEEAIILAALRAVAEACR